MSDAEEMKMKSPRREKKLNTDMSGGGFVPKPATPPEKAIV